MPFYILYLCKLSISMGVVWLFYQLLLRRLTFYAWNRWYLLIYSLFCFVIPLIDIRLFVREHVFTRPAQLVREIPVIWNAPVYHSAAASRNAWDIAPIILVAGAIVLLARLFLRLVSLWKIRHRARPVDGGGKFFVYDVNKPIIPFSFGRSIFINPRLHSREEWKEIILHEYVHVRQHHTIDIILSELLCIVSWYNPFAWLIRYSIRQNLEFIADDQVIGNGADRIEYQYHLLKVVGVAEYRIANSFNFSSLKKRIVMMNKIKSARLQLVKFLFIFPLLAVLLVAFRNKYTAMAADKQRYAALTGDHAAASASGKAIIDNRVAEEAGLAEEAAVKAADKNKTDVGRRTGEGKTPEKGTERAQRDSVPKGLRDTIRFGDGTSLMTNIHLEKILYVIDGKKMPAGFSPQDFTKARFPVPMENTVFINVLKNKAVSDYGEKDFKDVIVITTTEKAPFGPGIGGSTLLVPDTALDKVEYYVNGKVSNSNEAGKLDPRTIASVSASGSFNHYCFRIFLKDKTRENDTSRMMFRIDTLYTSIVVK